MEFFLSFIIVFVASLDVLAVGIACYLSKIRLKFFSEITICIVSALGVFVAMLAGKYLSELIDPKVCNIIAGILLILIAIKILFGCIKKRTSEKEKIEKADKNKNGRIEVFEVIFIAVALSANNAVLGISAYFMELSIIIMVFLTFAMTFLFLKLAKVFAYFLSKTKFSKIADLISASVMLALGIFLLF